MPFVSKKQMKLCYILQKQNKNSNWNCEEWSKKTDYSKLPEFVNKSRSKSRSRTRNKRRSRSSRSK
jgi:hypothetical protein